MVWARLLGFWKIAPSFCMRWTALPDNRKFARRWPVCMKIRENGFLDTLACCFAWGGKFCMVIRDLKKILGHIKTPVSVEITRHTKRISRPRRLVLEHLRAKVRHLPFSCHFWLKQIVRLSSFFVFCSKRYPIVNMEPQPGMPAANPRPADIARYNAWADRNGPVSYTHLTLPTIYTV